MSSPSLNRWGSIAGPAVTGALVATGLAHPWGFSFFAVVAVLGALAVAIAPADPLHPTPTSTGDLT